MTGKLINDDGIDLEILFTSELPFAVPLFQIVVNKQDEFFDLRPLSQFLKFYTFLTPFTTSQFLRYIFHPVPKSLLRRKETFPKCRLTRKDLCKIKHYVKSVQIRRFFFLVQIRENMDQKKFRIWTLFTQ